MDNSGAKVSSETTVVGGTQNSSQVSANGKTENLHMM